jgi:hypothetical protein
MSECGIEGPKLESQIQDFVSFVFLLFPVLFHLEMIINKHDLLTLYTVMHPVQESSIDIDYLLYTTCDSSFCVGDLRSLTFQSEISNGISKFQR